ncbi:UNVERIFIED_CONTAM: hypothetical protein K2H54_046390 [Gekko kuhli]
MSSLNQNMRACQSRQVTKWQFKGEEEVSLSQMPSRTCYCIVLPSWLWLGRASDIQSHSSSSNYFGTCEEGEDVSRRNGPGCCTQLRCPDDDVLKIQVSHDDDEEEEEDDEWQAPICSGSTNSPVKVILDEAKECDHNG